MKHRKAAPPCVPEPVPVTFIDVVSCFSEEEWKLLHHWQKELYRNVMKDIHQALLSLGPMIANSVFSLKHKEYEELGEMDIEDLKLNHDLNTFQGYSTGESNAVFRKTRSAKQHLKNSPDTNERGSCDQPNTGESPGDSNAAFGKTRTANEHLKDNPVTKEKGSCDMPSTDTIAIDSVSLKEEHDVETLDYSQPQGTKRPTETTRLEVTRSAASGSVADNEESYSIETQDYGGGEGVSSSVEPGMPMPYVPMGINEDGETYPIDIQDYGKSEGNSSYLGDEARTLMNEESVAYDETSLPCKGSSETKKVIVISKTAPGSRSGKCSASSWSLRGLKVSKFESDFGNNMPPSSYQGICKEMKYSGDNKPRVDLLNTHVLTGEANAAKTFGHNVSPKCNYQCKECKKCFRSKGHLIYHERTHSGEKPYHCSVCDKSFSQRHRLMGHERTHSGEKPFQCSICNRTFTWRDSLRRHHRTHTGERPYQCATCMKCFGQKETLVKHMEIHARHKQD